MTATMRRRGSRSVAGVAVGALTAAGLAVATAAPADADTAYWVPVGNTLHVLGRGFGHGHGLSQYGAQGAALEGKSYGEILRFYYPGTTTGRAARSLRVLISGDTTSDVIVSAVPGLGVRNVETGATQTLPANSGIQRWRLAAAPGGGTLVQYKNASGWHRSKQLLADAEFIAPGPLTLLVPSAGGLTGRSYRGALRSASPSPGSAVRDTVNVVGLEAYLRGVVPYEMPASWHRQALRAQSVAARSYALYEQAQNPGGHYQICDTTACQVYGGVAGEQPASSRAVRATARKVLRFQGKPALTQFSASSGGWTAAGGLPYLTAKPDPFDAGHGNAYHRWTHDLDVSAIDARYPSLGGLRAIRVTKRAGDGQWGGRVAQLTLVGRSHNVRLSGDEFRLAFALRSTWLAFEATAITRRWVRLGGRDSAFGAPRSGEYRVAGGAGQRFESGRIWWSRTTGARALRGPILHAYRARGGPAARLGFPTTGIYEIAGGLRARFQHGTATWLRDSRSVVVRHR